MSSMISGRRDLSLASLNSTLNEGKPPSFRAKALCGDLIAVEIMVRHTTVCDKCRSIRLKAIRDFRTEKRAQGRRVIGLNISPKVTKVAA